MNQAISEICNSFRANWILLTRTKEITPKKAEADESLEKFEAIRRRWLSSQSREIPQDLRDALNDQVKACDQLLSGKNSLLDSLHHELKSSEDEYVKTLKKQYDDLEIVAQRSEEQYKTMDQAYREEIKQIITALDSQFDDRIFDWRRQVSSFEYWSIAAFLRSRT